MSGHSKWSTIKRDKGKEDAKKGILFSKHAREIVVAAKQGTDPNANARLRRAIQAAKDISMPKDKIMYAIQRGSGQIPGKTYEDVLYEGYGPEGVAVLVEGLTDNKTRTVASLRFVFQKAGGNLGEKGCVNWMFETQSQVFFDKKTLLEQKKDILQLEEQAIEAGAEDIQETSDGIVIWTSDQDSLLKNLQGWGYQPDHCHKVKKAKNKVSLKAEGRQKVLKFLENLEDLEDIQNIYCNLEEES